MEDYFWNMGKVFWEKREIPCPPGACPNGGRVYVWRNLGGGKRAKLDIGRYARQEDNMFYPNTNFRVYYPDLWEEYYGDGNKLHHHLGIGLYAMTLAFGHKTGLYPILYDVFEPLYGNALIDYAMYSLKERSNVAYLFKPCMAGNVIFSKDRNDDDWLSDVFINKIDKEDISEFRARWIKRCKENGITKVWIAIDGSNSDYHLKDTFLGSKGKAKSGKNVNIVSYIWAIAEDGTPVTFFMNPGSTVDSKAFQEICTFLKSYDLDIEGVIVDKGFLSHDVLQLIRNSGYHYVANLKEDNLAHLTMHERHAEKIYLNIEYLMGEDGRFGITDGPIKLFEGFDDEAYVALYYDNKNGPARQNALFNKILKAKVQAEAQISKGQKPILPEEMREFLTIVEVDEEGNILLEVVDESGKEGGQDGVTNTLDTPNLNSEQGSVATTEESCANADTPENINGNNGGSNNSSENDGESKILSGKAQAAEESKEEVSAQCQKRYRVLTNPAKGKSAIMQKGFGSLASSKDMTAKEMDAIYDIRDISEKQYMATKSMMGYDVFRSHDDNGTQSRELVCFIGAIIRNEFVKVCRKLRLKPCRILEEIDEMVSLMLISDGTYTFIDKPRNDVRRFFSSLGYNREEFDILTGDVNERIRAKLEKNGGGVSQYHDEPYTIKKRDEMRRQRKKKKSAGDAQKPEDAPKKRRGRPPGRKNNKTLKREALEAACGHEEADKPKRGRGRPPGRKNNKTLEREAMEAAANTPDEADKTKRKRGRPVGSKDSTPRKRRTKAEIMADTA